MGGGAAYLGELEQMLLWVVIRLEDQAYGMSIREELERRGGRSISRGTVYITLDRLVKKGYVATRMGEPSAKRGGRAKRFVKITKHGLEALARSRNTLSRLSSGLEWVVEGEP